MDCVTLWLMVYDSHRDKLLRRVDAETAHSYYAKQRIVDGWLSATICYVSNLHKRIGRKGLRIRYFL